MAYMSAEDVKAVRENVNKEFPKNEGWIISVTKQHHSGVRISIMSAPIDCEDREKKNYTVHDFDLNKDYTVEQVPVFKRLLELARTENYFDKSDSMTDYFHVSHYYDVEVGKWDKDFMYKKNEKFELIKKDFMKNLETKNDEVEAAKNVEVVETEEKVEESIIEVIDHKKNFAAKDLKSNAAKAVLMSIAKSPKKAKEEKKEENITEAKIVSVPEPVKSAFDIQIVNVNKGSKRHYIYLPKRFFETINKTEVVVEVVGNELLICFNPLKDVEKMSLKIAKSGASVHGKKFISGIVEALGKEKLELIRFRKGGTKRHKKMDFQKFVLV